MTGTSAKFILPLLLALGSIVWASSSCHAQPPDHRLAFTAQAAQADTTNDPEQQLDSILRQPIHQRWKLRQLRGAPDLDDDQSKSWLARQLESFFDWLGDVVEDFFSWLGRRSIFSGSGGPASGGSSFVSILETLGYILLAAVGLLLLYLVIRAWRQGQFTRPRKRVLSREQVAQAMEEGEALALEGPQWLGEAQRLAREGNFRAMYRALYLALLSGLHATGKIDFRRNRTNWTYVRRFKGPEHELPTFERLTALFDSVWYGLKPADHVDLEVVRSEVTSLIQEESVDA